MKTKLRVRGKRNQAYNAVSVHFPKELSGKAVALLKQDETCERQLKGSVAVLPVPEMGEYIVSLKMPCELWNNETAKNIMIKTEDKTLHPQFPE